MKRNSIKKQQGFTLIEIVLAVFIVGLIGVVVAFSVSSATGSVDRVDAKASQLNGINGLFLRLSRDIEHMVAKGVTNGTSKAPAVLYEGEDSDRGLEFTNAAWVNPLPEADLRSRLQRVAYVFEDNKIIRKRWAKLNQEEAGDEEYEQVLLENVEKFEFRFLVPVSPLARQVASNNQANKPQWEDTWPPSNIGGVNVATANAAQTNMVNKLLPTAIELTIEQEGLGEIKRLYEVIDVSQ